MIIQRTIRGIVEEIELTDEELLNAYEEAERAVDEANVRSLLKEQDYNLDEIPNYIIDETVRCYRNWVDGDKEIGETISDLRLSAIRECVSDDFLLENEAERN